MSDEVPEPRTATFAAHFYEVDSLEIAKQVTVTGEQGMSSEERWSLETPWIVESIGQYLPLSPATTLVDYGCGVGRFAKELIEKFGCGVAGIDASQAMRQFAPQHVGSSKFFAWSPQELDAAIQQGFRADHCISIWVIQHVFQPLEVIERISRVLRPGGLFYALNMTVRCVPTNVGYVNDNFDVPQALREHFAEEHTFRPPAGIMPPELADWTIIQVLRKRA